MTKTMKAVCIHQFGGLDVLSYQDLPRPVPAAGEVLIRVRAAGVNPVDWKTRSGSVPWKTQIDPFPLVLGWDVAGTVAATGQNVTGFAVGDAVYGMIRFPEPAGTYAEYATAPAAHVLHKPESIDFGIMEKAKEANMPSDNIKRAIKKGTGELPGTSYEETTYEGYGPGGVALLLEILTDNKNRTVGEIRHILTKHNGNMGEAGCVAWMFDQKGYILVKKKSIDEDTLMSLALDAGAEDFKSDPEEENYEITTVPEDLNRVKEFLKAKNIAMDLAEITMIPQNYVKLESKDAARMLKLMEALEDHDDVQNVYANFDIPDEMMAEAE
jgi:YebC/PmpR family DNA-binding regulatory protein